MTIHKKNYIKWYKNEYKKPGGDASKEIPPSLSFKKHLIDVIEENLTNDLEVVKKQQNNLFAR